MKNPIHEEENNLLDLFSYTYLICGFFDELIDFFRLKTEDNTIATIFN